MYRGFLCCDCEVGLGTYNFTKFKNNTDNQEKYNIRVPELISFEITKKQGITI